MLKNTKKLEGLMRTLKSIGEGSIASIVLLAALLATSSVQAHIVLEIPRTV